MFSILLALTKIQNYGFALVCFLQLRESLNKWIKSRLSVISCFNYSICAMILWKKLVEQVEQLTFSKLPQYYNLSNYPSS